MDLHLIEFGELPFPNLLRVLMVERGLNSRSLAAISGLSQSGVSRMRLREGNHNFRYPSPMALLRILAAMDAIKPVPPAHKFWAFVRAGYLPPYPITIIDSDARAGTVSVRFDTSVSLLARQEDTHG